MGKAGRSPNLDEYQALVKEKKYFMQVFLSKVQRGRNCVINVLIFATDVVNDES